jgi:hypothetical protein
MFTVHYSLQLLTIHCSLLTTYCSLHINNCALGSLLTINSLSMLTAHNSLLSAHCLLAVLLTACRLNAYCSLITAKCLLSTAQCSLPITYYSLLFLATAYCRYFLLLIASCSLLTTSFNLICMSCLLEYIYPLPHSYLFLIFMFPFRLHAFSSRTSFRLTSIYHFLYFLFSLCIPFLSFPYIHLLFPLPLSQGCVCICTVYWTCFYPKVTRFPRLFPSETLT